MDRRQHLTWGKRNIGGLSLGYWPSSSFQSFTLPCCRSGCAPLSRYSWPSPRSGRVKKDKEFLEVRSIAGGSFGAKLSPTHRKPWWFLYRGLLVVACLRFALSACTQHG